MDECLQELAQLTLNDFTLYYIDFVTKCVVSETFRGEDHSINFVDVFYVMLCV